MKRPNKADQLEAFSNLFDAFKSVNLDWQAKYAGFERVLLDSKMVDHWLITGISRDALEYVVKNGFSKTNKGVVRGHIKDRKDRAKHLFTHSFQSNEEAFEYFMGNDRVILITKNENSIKKGPSDWSEVYKIPSEIFPYRCGYSAKYTDDALSFLKNLALAKNIRINE